MGGERSRGLPGRAKLGLAVGGIALTLATLRGGAGCSADRGRACLQRVADEGTGRPSECAVNPVLHWIGSVIGDERTRRSLPGIEQRVDRLTIEMASRADLDAVARDRAVERAAQHLDPDSWPRAVESWVEEGAWAAAIAHSGQPTESVEDRATAVWAALVLGDWDAAGTVALLPPALADDPLPDVASLKTLAAVRCMRGEIDAAKEVLVRVLREDDNPRNHALAAVCGLRDRTPPARTPEPRAADGRRGLLTVLWRLAVAGPDARTLANESLESLRRVTRTTATPRDELLWSLEEAMAHRALGDDTGLLAAARRGLATAREAEVFVGFQSSDEPITVASSEVAMAWLELGALVRLGRTEEWRHWVPPSIGEMSEVTDVLGFVGGAVGPAASATKRWRVRTHLFAGDWSPAWLTPVVLETLGYMVEGDTPADATRREVWLDSFGPTWKLDPLRYIEARQAVAARLGHANAVEDWAKRRAALTAGLEGPAAGVYDAWRLDFVGGTGR